MVAAQTQSVDQGLAALQAHVSQARLQLLSASIVPLRQGQAYQSRIEVNFTPMFSPGTQLPTPGQPISLFSPQVAIRYNAVSQSATF
jgi:hypothetical protein